MKERVLLNDWCRYFLVFQLIFDNYTGAGPSDVSPATSHSARVLGDASLDVSSCPESINQEIADLRQQLQSMKQQTVIVLAQSRKSSEREQAALRQAQEALELKETATANSARSAQRESYMLDLMTDASQDMAGTLLLSCCFLDILRIPFCAILFFPCVAHRLVSGCCCRRTKSEFAGWNPSSSCQS